MESAEIKLDGLITNAAIGVLGRYDLSAIVSTDPETLRARRHPGGVAREDRVVDVATERYGIAIERVAFERVSLPEENTVPACSTRCAPSADNTRPSSPPKGGARHPRFAPRPISRRPGFAPRVSEKAAARIRWRRPRAEAARIYADAHNVDPRAVPILAVARDASTRWSGEQTSVILRTDSEPFRLLERAQ